MTRVIVGDTRSIKNIARLRDSRLGLGSFADRRPTPYEGEPWCFDNGAFHCWTHGVPFDEPRFIFRIKVAASIGVPLLAVVPDIVAAGCTSLAFSPLDRENSAPTTPVEGVAVGISRSRTG